MVARGKAVTTLPKLIGSLQKEPSKPKYPQILPSLRRAFSLYDQINLIDNVTEDQLRFQGYTETGFTVNGVDYEGSLLCVGNLLTSWAPKKFSEVIPDRLKNCHPTVLAAVEQKRNNYLKPCTNGSSLSCFIALYPSSKLYDPYQILILGCGKYIEQVNPELSQFVRSTGMKLEALDSRNAASTYNILNEDGRIVAAALIPYGVSS